jgi:colanic acid biosynthesis glycosyl transferase WcaI
MIVIASELFWPEYTSTGKYLTDIADALAADDNVLVLCSQPTYAARGKRGPRVERRNGVLIRRVRSTVLDKNRFLPRLVNAVTFAGAMLLAAIRYVPRNGRVLVVTNPPLLPFVMALVCRLRGARMVLLIHDVYPDVLVASGIARQGGALARLMGAGTGWLHARAERIIVLGRDMEALIAARTPRPKGGIAVIPHWADEGVRPVPRQGNALLEDLGIEDRFVLQYAGNMGRSHGIEDLLEVTRRLDQSADPPAHLLFIGTGARRRVVERAIATEGIPVSLLDPQPASRLSETLGACDLAVVAFRPGMSGVSVPSRLYNILAAGRPILALADADSEVARVIREERVGWVCEPGNVTAALEAVEEARAACDERAAMGRRARTVAEEKYRLAPATEAYRAVLRSVGVD